VSFWGAKVKAGGRTQKTKHTHILRKSTADFWATLLWLSLVAVVVLAMADFFMIMCLIAREGGFTIPYHIPHKAGVFANRSDLI